MPQYNYENLTSKQLREYARDLARTARRVVEIADWMDDDEVEQVCSHNSAIGVRAQAYSQKYANAIEEAVTQYKHNNSRYKPKRKRGRK